MNVYVPSNSCVKILFLKGDGVGDRSLPKTVRDQISNLVTLSLLFHYVMIQQEVTRYEAEINLSNIKYAFILDFLSINKFILFITYVIYNVCNNCQVGQYVFIMILRM